MYTLELDQVQSCISTLFDIRPVKLADDPIINSSSLIGQVVQYGRKLIQITERLDQFHKRTVSMHETKVYNHIADIYAQYGFKDNRTQSEHQMLDQISMELKRNASSVKKSQHSSKAASKRSHKEIQITKKEIRILREEFTKDEQLWRELYVKVETISEKYCERRFVQTNSGSLGKQSQSLSQSIRANNSAVHDNLVNLSKFLDSLLSSLPQAKNSKVNQLITQIEQRQNVFSYSMSKLLESFRNLKNPSNNNNEQIHDNITGLISKLFDIYPSSTLLRNLDLKEEPLNVKEYLTNSKQVQCNIKVESKKEAQLKNISLTFFRFRTKIQQAVKRVEGTLRLKKQVDTKELQKFLEELKESTVYNQQINYDEVTQFQTELLTITSNSERSLNELREELQRHQKKAAKNLQTYQQGLKSLTSELASSEDKNLKLGKKVDLEKAQKQKLKDKVTELQSIRDHLQSEVQKGKQMLREEHKEQLKEQKLIKAEYDFVIKEKRSNEEQYNSLLEKLMVQQKLMEDERHAFISKVKLMEGKQESLMAHSSETKHCLEQMIQDNKLLRDRLEEFTVIHQDKIRECESIAAEYGKLEKHLEGKLLENKQQKINMSAQKSLLESLQSELRDREQQLDRIRRDGQSATTECNRYKQLGRLNQEDIESLKEEFEKVHKQYTQVEAENQHLKSSLQIVTIEHAKAAEIQQRCSAIVLEREVQIRQLKRDLSQFEEQNKFLRDEARIKETQFQQLLRSTQASKQQRKQGAKLKREISEVRNSLATSELQYNVAKQELQNIRQEHQARKSLQKSQVKTLSAKFQTQIDSLKLEIRRNKETWQKEKKNYEREKQLASQKIAQLNQLLAQKETLTNRIKALRS